MITFLNLKIENFMSFAEASIPLAGHGLVCIQGENLDHGGSNGAGKTALCEALHWGLYGTTLRRAAVSQVIHQGQTYCSVIVTFEADGHRYDVERERTPTKTSLLVSIDGVLQQRATIALSQAIIDDVMAPQVFRNTVLFGPGLPRFMRVTDAERKQLILEMLDVDFSQAYQRAKERRQRTRAELDVATAHRDRLRDTLATAEAHLAAVTSDRDRQVKVWEADQQVHRRQLATAQQERAVCDVAIQQSAEEVQFARSALEEYQEHLAQEQAEHGAAAAQWAEQGRRIREMELKLSRAMREREHTAEAWEQTTRTNAARRADLGRQTQDTTEALEQQELLAQIQRDTIAALNVRVQEATTNLAGLQSSHQAYSKQRAALAETLGQDFKICPTCGQRTTHKALAAAIAKVDAEVQRLDAKEQAISEAITQDKAAMQAARDALLPIERDIARSKKTLQDCERNLALLAQQAATPSPLPAMDEAIASLQEQLSALRAEYDHGAATIPSRQATIDDLRKLVASQQRVLAERQHSFTSAQVSLARIDGAIHAIEQRLAQPSPAESLAATIAQVTQHRAQLAEQLTAAQAALPIIEAQLREYHIWEQAFHKDGCPALALAELTGRLRDAAAEYARQLSEGALQLSLSVDDRDALTIQASLAGTAPSYDLLSEGWRACADLAVFLACHGLAGRSNLLMVDEALDAIDQVRLGLLLKVLVGKTGGEGSVFVISHRDDVRAMLHNSSGLATKELVVVLADGYSTVEWGDMSIPVMMPEPVKSQFSTYGIPSWVPRDANGRPV